MQPLQQALGRRVYYGWVVVGVTVLMSLVMWGVRSAPSVLLKPLEADFGWSRTEISSALAIGLVMTGFAAVGAGLLMDRFSIRATMLGVLVIGGAAVGLASRMSALWHMTLLWGVMVGIATGVSGVFGAPVAARWFVEGRGTVQGILGAGTSSGQLIFLPLLTWMVVNLGWRKATWILAILTACVIPVVFLLMRDRPADVGLLPRGATEEPSRGAPPPVRELIGMAAHRSDFWLLAASFFICGATSTGLIGQHFQAHALDHGYAAGAAAGALAVMGSLNFVGVLLSGWLTDRHDPRKLLAIYYTFRAISLFFLPFLTDMGIAGLWIFAVVYGLDWIATVPPTMTLCAELFGRRNVGTIYGFVFGAHQFGAALLAFLAGYVHDRAGDYTIAFVGAGVLGLVGGLMAMRIERPAPAGRIAMASPAD